MSDNENSFTHNGEEYVAVDGYYTCFWCDLNFDNCQTGGIPSCRGKDRKDGRDVIFKKRINLEMGQEK